MVPPDLIKFYTLPPSLRKYKWHPGLLLGTPCACGFIRGPWFTCHPIDVCGRHRWFPVVMLVGVNIYHSVWCIRLQNHVLRTEECWSNLSARHTVVLHQLAPSQRRSLRWWRGREDKGIRFLYPWPRRNLQQFVFLMYHPENYLASLSATEELKQIQKRLMQSWTWKLRPPSKTSRNSLDAWLPWIDFYRDSAKEDSLSSNCWRNKTNSNGPKKQPMHSKTWKSTSSHLLS